MASEEGILGYRPAVRKEWYRTPHEHPRALPARAGAAAGQVISPDRDPVPPPAPTDLLMPRHAPRGTGSTRADRAPGLVRYSVVTSPAAEASAPRCPPPRHRRALPGWPLACPIARSDRAAWQSHARLEPHRSPVAAPSRSLRRCPISTEASKPARLLAPHPSRTVGRSTHPGVGRR